MYHSGETRWYFEGILPGDIRDWFESSGNGSVEAERTDEYLLLPGCESTSIKVREGRFEVNAITRSPQPTTYTNNVAGYQDAWVKWSRKAPNLSAFRKMISDAEDRWAFVRKGRYLRKFSLDEGAPAEVNAATDRPDRGCQVEATSIRAIVSRIDAPPMESDWSLASPWWSLSLESFAPHTTGITETVIADLSQVANHFFRTEPPCNLGILSSLSYPVWLSKLM